MALSDHLVRETSDRQNLTFVITNAVVVYDGALVGLNETTGKVVLWSDNSSAVLTFLGYAQKGGTGNSGGTVETSVNCAGANLVRVTVGGTPTISDITCVGDLVYATDDNTFTRNAAGEGPIGIISRWYSSTTVDVLLFTPTEFRAYRGS